MYSLKFVCLCLVFVIASVCIASAQETSDLVRKDVESPLINLLRNKRSPHSKYYKIKVPKYAVATGVPVQPVLVQQPTYLGGGCGTCGRPTYVQPVGFGGFGGGFGGFGGGFGGGHSSSQSSSQSSSFGGGSASSSQSSSFSSG